MTAGVWLLDSNMAQKCEQILMKVSGNDNNGPKKFSLNFSYVVDTGGSLIF